MSDFPFPYERQLIKTNDVILHVVLAGPEDGPLVVLLHGFPEFWYGWRRQIDALAQAGFRVAAPDQRGYNQSDKPKDIADYMLRRLVDDINGLVRALGRDTAHIVGHDWGAMVAWGLALTYPRRINKLSILNVPHPVVFQHNLRTNPAQMLKSWYGLFFQLPWLPEQVFALGSAQFALRGIQASGRRGSFTDADLEMYRKAWSKPGAMRSMLHWYRAFVQHPPTFDENARVKVPTLMIWGAKDRFLSASMAQQSIDLCDDGRLVMLDKATHWVQHDAADEVNRLLIEFLK